jgi:hypothetical protein
VGASILNSVTRQTHNQCQRVIRSAHRANWLALADESEKFQVFREKMSATRPSAQHHDRTGASHPLVAVTSRARMEMAMVCDKRP